MTRRPYKNCDSNDDVASSGTTGKLTNGHITRQSSHELLKVQCNGGGGSKLLSPSGSDVLPLPSSGHARRSSRRASASWCGSTRELADDLSPTETELGIIALRPKTHPWLPIALIGTIAEENGSNNPSSQPTKTRKKKLSPEEKLLRDNKHYFKMEVLNAKLRSAGALPMTSNHYGGVVAGQELGRKKFTECTDENAILKVNGVQQEQRKRRRRTQLMKLCDEAESFMFGECSRSTAADSIAEDPSEEAADHTVAVAIADGRYCDEDAKNEEKSPPKKKRRSHAEAFIHDNIDYYKFETVGSRLRHHSGGSNTYDTETSNGADFTSVGDEFSKVVFSFETLPCQEPWYETYRRQDENREERHPVISDPSNQPFLLPYEMPRSYVLGQHHGVLGTSRRPRTRNPALQSVIANTSSPRKSPRCHASTLAILSSMRRSSGRKRRSGVVVGVDSKGVEGGNDDELTKLLNEDGSFDKDFCLIEPEDVDAESIGKRRGREKKTHLRCKIRCSDKEAVIFTNQDTLDIVELVHDFYNLNTPGGEFDPLSKKVGYLRRGRRKHRKKVNRTGWEKPKKRLRERPPKLLPDSLFFSTETVSNNNNNSGNVEKDIGDCSAMDISPCVVRVQKLKLRSASVASEIENGFGRTDAPRQKIRPKRRKKRRAEYAWSTHTASATRKKKYRKR